MQLGAVAVVADDLVLVAEGLLLRLKQLQVGRCGLRDLVVVLHLEFI